VAASKRGSAGVRSRATLQGVLAAYDHSISIDQGLHGVDNDWLPGSKSRALRPGHRLTLLSA
jgi:hypothetical protein